jgi:hypothetical protein
MNIEKEIAKDQEIINELVNKYSKEASKNILVNKMFKLLNELNNTMCDIVEELEERYLINEVS